MFRYVTLEYKHWNDLERGNLLLFIICTVYLLLQVFSSWTNRKEVEYLSSTSTYITDKQFENN